MAEQPSQPVTAQAVTSQDNAAATSEPQIAAGGLPLFYHDPKPLEQERHRGAGLRAKGDYLFARNANSCPANIGEMLLLAKSYPLVFVGADVPMPVAVMGLDTHNAFIDPQGNWVEGCYIPAYIRRYPFVLIRGPKDDEKYFLAIDEGSALYVANNPERPFFQDGAETDVITNALKFCETFQQDNNTTQRFVETLMQHNLLQDNGVSVTVAEGKDRKLGGFKIVNTEALNNLPDDAYLSLRKSGYLPFIYAHLSSLDNWPRIVMYANRHGLDLTQPVQQAA